MKDEQVAELLYQALETEKGGVQIYETALRCAANADLKQEWEEYLRQTREHEQIILEVMDKLGLDPGAETPGRHVVRHIGESLVEAMEMALDAGKPEAAQVVACECVVLRDQGPPQLGADSRGDREGQGRAEGSAQGRL
jgi:ferritin-like metal-binding protein YciE